jgi:uncharacterized protein (DUF58 family)
VTPAAWPRPTRRGWGVAAGSLALVLAGRLMGALELFVLAAGGTSLLVGSFALVAGRRPRVTALRRLPSQRACAGEPTRVELRVTNQSRTRSPNLTLHDVLGSRSAALPLGSLPPGGGEAAHYRLPPLARGLHRIGPLEVHVTDPFHLARTVTTLVPPTDLLVYPRVHALRPLTSKVGEDPRGGTRPLAPGGGGDEFSTLRAYQVGDDLRWVHWPSTARQGDLVVRQHEAPRQGRLTVLLDSRAEVHTEATFEAAVSAAASILAASRRPATLVRLVTTTGHDSGFGSSAHHLETALAELAVIQPDDGAATSSLTELGGHVTAPPHASALVVVTTDAGAGPELHRASEAGHRREVTVVSFDGSLAGRSEALPGRVRVGRPDMFVPTWDRAVARAGRRSLR